MNFSQLLGQFFVCPILLATPVMNPTIALLEYWLEGSELFHIIYLK
jgi:hypothetical protein